MKPKLYYKTSHMKIDLRFLIKNKRSNRSESKIPTLTAKRNESSNGNHHNHSKNNNSKISSNRKQDSFSKTIDQKRIIGDWETFKSSETKNVLTRQNQKK